jgi:hypothetical protein
MTRISEILIEIQELKEENQSLRLDNDFLQRQNKALKLRCSNYCLQVRDLESEIKDLRFTHKYLTSEEAGRAFARELLGKPMTEEDLAIEAGENGYKPYTGDDF